MGFSLKELIEKPDLRKEVIGEKYSIKSVEEADFDKIDSPYVPFGGADEYYARLGNSIEQHPITSARVRRG